jgi:hypothetical protein
VSTAVAAPVAGRLLMTIAVAIVVAWAGLVYHKLAAMSRASASAGEVRRGRIAADYDLTRVRWSTADARALSTREGHLDLVTGDGPYLYEAIATVPTGGASIAHLAFRGRVTRGGLTVGLVANGRWLANRSVRAGREFDDLLTTRLARTPTLMIVVANCNPAGESIGAIEELKLYLVR